MTEIGTGLFMPIENTDMIGSGSCGIPAPFREACIVDSDGRHLGPGEIGELLMRGPGLTLGYYKRTESTNAAFRDGWFRTGDLFKRDKRGFYYMVGRVKDMIRRAGENIAALELETVLVGLQDVAEAAVVPVKDELRGEEVKAYIVPRAEVKDQHTLLLQVMEHCMRNLAPFKVPRYFEFRDSLEKTASGKIAKHALQSETHDLRAGSFDRINDEWIR